MQDIQCKIQIPWLMIDCFILASNDNSRINMFCFVHVLTVSLKVNVYKLIDINCGMSSLIVTLQIKHWNSIA